MPPALDEPRLARAAAGGDGEAFAALYDAYERRIFTYCHRLLGSREDAADATQDAFIKVLQRLPQLGERELNFGAYLFTAARNASYDVIGRRKRTEVTDELPETGAQRMMADERAADVQEPEKAAMLGALQGAVQAANARLPERHREVLVLREVEELSYDEIAEIMGMKRNAVAQLIFRARVGLRNELRGDALASIATSSPACERALPLLAARQDGQLDDAADAAWLDDHVGGCATCRVSAEALEEAGVSYRAWLPIVPLIWLRQETIAKAAESVGADWSAVAARGRRADAGGTAGSGGTSSAGAGAGAGAGVVPGAADASTAGSTTVGEAAEALEPDGRRRRSVLAGLLGVILLLLLAVAVVAGDDDQSTSAPAAETLPTTTAAITTAVTEPAATVAATRAKQRAPRSATTSLPDEQAADTVAAPDVATAPTSSSSAPRRAPRPHTRKPTKTTSEKVSEDTPRRRPVTPVTTTPPTTTTEPPPPTTTPEPTPDPPVVTKPEPPTTDTTTTTTPPPPPPQQCQRGDKVCCRLHPNDPGCRSDLAPPVPVADLRGGRATP